MEALRDVGLVPPFDILLILLMSCGSIASGITNRDRDLRASTLGIIYGAFVAIIVGAFTGGWYPLTVLACILSAGAGVFIAVLCSRNTIALIAGSVNGATAGLLTSSTIFMHGVISKTMGDILILWLMFVLLEYASYWVVEGIHKLRGD